MANAIYDKFREARMTADSNIDLENGDVRCILVDAAVFYAFQADNVQKPTLTIGQTATLSGRVTGPNTISPSLTHPARLSTTVSHAAKASTAIRRGASLSNTIS